MAKIDVTILQPVVVVKNLIENIKKIDVKLGKLEEKEHLTVVEKQEKEELAKKKEDVNSLEFIEQTAREKLDMFYPNEKVYIDKGM